jgi:hypothetical protein
VSLLPIAGVFSVTTDYTTSRNLSSKTSPSSGPSSTSLAPSRTDPKFLGAQGKTKIWSPYVHMNNRTLLDIREKTHE